jgi:hypothetical protein
MVKKAKRVENIKNSKAEKSFERSEKLIKGINKEYKNLMKRLKKKGVDARDDATTLSTLRLLFETTVEMIPEAARSYHKYPGQNAAYSYTNLVQTVLQLMETIRGVSDLQAQVEHIQKEIINTGLKLIVSNLSEEMFELKRWAKLNLDKKAYRQFDVKLDNSLRNQGSFIKDVIGKMEQDLLEYLVE